LPIEEVVLHCQSLIVNRPAAAGHEQSTINNRQSTIGNQQSYVLLAPDS